MSEAQLTAEETIRQARERVEQRESGVIAERYEEFARSVAPLRD